MRYLIALAKLALFLLIMLAGLWATVLFIDFVGEVLRAYRAPY